MKKIIVLLLIPVMVFGAKITDNELIIGKSGQDFEIKNRDKDLVLKANSATSKWQVSTDSGSNFFDIATGTGGGGGGTGGPLNVLPNPNAEDGLSSISNTGGVLTAVTVPLADILEGSTSFSFDPAIQNDEVAFSSVTISKGLYDRTCEARVSYIGGDANSTIEVVDANALVIGSSAMVVRTIYGPQSFEFACPTSAGVGGDANKGILTLKIRQTTVTDGAVIIFDENHLGEQLHVTQSELDSELALKVKGVTNNVLLFGLGVNSGGAIFINYGVGVVSSITSGGTGIRNINLIGGVCNSTPVCVSQVYGGFNNHGAFTNALSANLVQVRTGFISTATPAFINFTVDCFCIDN